MLRRTLRSLCVDVQRKELETSISRMNATLKPLDHYKRFVPQNTYSTPLVIMLGNHSAGKSSLINSLLGIKEQQTGVAPTDDGFTALRRGDVDLDEDGPTAVSNLEYGFGDLRVFGPSFVNRFKIKTRNLPKESELPANMMIIDTPGMIDTPVNTGAHRTSVEGQQRGYDFLAVTKWFATRADVILLMFDPANPGTTGETLDVMQKSLTGQEHKFLILLNKVDMFEKVTDFARCYGTLCWNLSKNIREKDIPRIYTTYTSKDVTVNRDPAAPLSELDAVRMEVFRELLRAPLRRLDNLLTENEEAARRVQMAAVVSNAVRSAARAHRLPRMIASCGLLASLPVGFSVLLAPLELTAIAVLGVGSAAGVAAALHTMRRQVVDYERSVVDRLDETFADCYVGQEQTAEVRDRWSTHVRPLLQEYLKDKGAAAVPLTSKSELRRLTDLITKEVPRLRKVVKEYKESQVRSKDAPQ